MDIHEFEGRKRDHIQHALNPACQAYGLSGLDRVHLAHEALPDLDFADVSVSARCLGKSVRTPFFIAAMTAGHSQAAPINRALALACQQRGWAMGVGSQRRDLDDIRHGRTNSAIDQWRDLREEAPDVPLFANIGLSQIVKAPTTSIRKIAEAIGANALVVHANPLQEALQPEGTPSFKGAFSALARLCEELPIPVVLKETGCGFSRGTLARVAKLSLAAVDISGLGGTHWGRVEGARAPSKSAHAAAAATFANWGESTVDSVIAARGALPKSMEIWASGGVRSGLDAAKLIALGAHCVGYAKPALEAALESPAALSRWMEIQEYELRVALFCTGSATPDVLRNQQAGT